MSEATHHADLPTILLLVLEVDLEEVGLGRGVLDDLNGNDGAVLLHRALVHEGKPALTNHGTEVDLKH